MRAVELSVAGASAERSSGLTPVLLGAERQKAQIFEAFQTVRATTEALAAPLNPEDMVVQTMPDVSPTKWHLAHTTWFFQTFLLDQYPCDYARPDPMFGYLFNSYYEQVGRQFPRPQRGWLSRPSLEEVLGYRRAINEGIEAMIACAKEAVWPEVAERMILGMHHEKQHQELLLTDIKHVLSVNPLHPTAYPVVQAKPQNGDLQTAQPQGNLNSEQPNGDAQATSEQLVSLGRDADECFCFDCETPSHRVLLQNFALAPAPVSNAEYCEFIEAEGYCKPEWWPSDGWALVCAECWRQPLYWHADEAGNWFEFTLHGLQPLDPAAPVSHLSWYEAQAYATFRQARLPTEAELEYAGGLQVANCCAPLAQRHRHPRQSAADAQVWLWTGSAFLPYPGFRPPTGPIGEYNGKFMSGQMVLKGGSCLTPEDHLRPSYRNFFPPHSRWQMTGLRLAHTL